jgi:CheY-like chemotaxis protein
VSELLSGRRILVVEDEMVILLMIEDMLSDLGCRSVTSAATVEKAVSLVESEFFDAAMLDMNLGGEDSHAVANALSERGVPFMYSTGNSRGDIGEGFRDHVILYKPYLDADLSAAFARLLS